VKETISENRFFGTIAIILIVLMAIGFLSSCGNSKSQFNAEHPEFKAVVLSVENNTYKEYREYRLKDLAKGVTVSRRMLESYIVGDTIILRR